MRLITIHLPAKAMALNPALKQLIEAKLAHTPTPQWMLPITGFVRHSAISGHRP
jgi:hypothetical protein